MESPVAHFPISISNEALALFERIMDSLLHGLYITDQERRITYWNQAAEKLTGYKAEEVLGKRCGDNFLAQFDCSGCL